MHLIVRSCNNLALRMFQCLIGEDRKCKINCRLEKKRDLSLTVILFVASHSTQLNWKKIEQQAGKNISKKTKNF